MLGRKAIPRGAMVGRAPLAMIVLLIGCAPVVYRTMPLRAFENAAPEYDGRVIGITLDRGMEIAYVPMDALPSDAVTSHPRAASDRSYMVVERTRPDAIVACMTDFVFGGSQSFSTRDVVDPVSGVSTPGVTFHIPSDPHRKHSRSRTLEATQVIMTEDHVIGFVPRRRDRHHSYFYRDRRVDAMVEQAHWLLHPGYSIVGEDFWVVVPREHIASMRVYREDYDELIDVAALDTSDSTSSAEFQLDFDCSAVQPWIAARTDELAHATGMGIAAAARIVSLSTADQRALCMASEGRIEEALTLLDQTISEVTEVMVWGHDSLFGVYVVRLLLCIQIDDLDGAREALGNLYAMTPPGWEPSMELALAVIEGGFRDSEFRQPCMTAITERWAETMNTLAETGS